MRRNEAITAFAALGGVMFLVGVLVPIFLYAFGPTGSDRTFLLAGFMGLSVGIGTCLYGISVILRELGPELSVPAPRVVDPALNELMRQSTSHSATARDMMSQLRTLIELENWVQAEKRASDLIAQFPETDEAAKAKKSLPYLREKSGKA